MKFVLRRGIPAALAALLALPGLVSAQEVDWREDAAAVGPDGATYFWSSSSSARLQAPVGFSLSGGSAGVAGQNMSSWSSGGTAMNLRWQMQSGQLFVGQESPCSTNECREVPEPASSALLLMGLVGLGVVGFRRHRAEPVRSVA